MDGLKKMSCPHCGYKYGVRWISFPLGHKKGFLPAGKECKVCKTPLCLEGENAQVARRIFLIALIPNIVILNLLVMGAVVNSTSGSGFSAILLFDVFLYLLMAIIATCIVLYVVNCIYINFLKKNVGYLSFASDAKHVFKNRWYN